MNKTDQESDEVVFYEEASRPASWFIILAAGTFGLLFFGSGVSKIPRIRADDWCMLVMGASFLFFSWRLFLFLLRPRMVIGQHSMLIRNFLSTHRFQFKEVVSMGTFTKTFRPRSPSGRSMNHLLTTTHLVIRFRNGKEKTRTLPSFGGNARIINLLEERLGFPVERLPDIDKT